MMNKLNMIQESKDKMMEIGGQPDAILCDEDMAEKMKA